MTDERVLLNFFYRFREMLCVVYGFPTKKEALAFEWNWQKPFLSKLLRTIANDLVAQKTFGNRWKLKFKVRIMFEMLQISPWNRFPLTVHWLGRNPVNTPSLYPPFPSPPTHIKQIYAPMSDIDMLLQHNANEDQEDAFESGEEDHDDEEDVANIETDPTPSQIGNNATLNRSSSALARYAALWGEEMPDLDFFERNSLTRRSGDQTSSNNNAPHSTKNTASSETTSSRAPRRSLSASSVVRTQPTNALPKEMLDYHNKSIEEDDDSFLQVPAFAPVAAAKPTSSSRGTVSSTSSSSRAKSATSVNATSSARMEVDEPLVEGDVKCFVCALQVLKLEHGICCSKDECAMVFHIVCLATKALKDEEVENGPTQAKNLIPASATCPSCNSKHRWMDLVRHKQRAMNHGSNPLKTLVLRAEGK